MNIQLNSAFSAIRPIGLVVLLSLVAIPRAQAETITATAKVKNAGGVEASAPVSVTLDRYSTDAERDKVLATLKQGGTAGVRALLLTSSPLGSVRVGTVNTVIKFAYSRTTPDGRLVTVVTGSPIAFVGAGLPGAPPKTGYDLGLLALSLVTAGPGHGELTPAAKVRLNDQGAIVTEDYGGELVVQLSNVVGK
jgi:hypothetical protein